MPTVLIQNGFQVRIRLPPREHGPPHVHVFRDGGSVTILLPHAGRPIALRSVYRMRNPVIVSAVRLVEAHAARLLTQWRKYHGDPDDQ